MQPQTSPDQQQILAQISALERENLHLCNKIVEMKSRINALRVEKQMIQRGIEEAVNRRQPPSLPNCESSAGEEEVFGESEE